MSFLVLLQGGNSCVYKCRKIGDDSQHYAVKITKSDQEEIIRSVRKFEILKQKKR